MPIRATLAIVATIAGVLLLFSFRTPAPPVAGSTGLPSTSAHASALAGPPSLPAATAPPCPPTVVPPSIGEGDDQQSRNSPPAVATPCATGGASPTTPAGTPAGIRLRDGSYTGQDVPNQFGDVQVNVVVSGGHITDVQAPLLPSDRARSAFISQQAGPILRSEALRAQSAQIDIVSGATYTSESYAASLQSALDQARA